jgi:aminomethyltransferase
VEIFVPSHDAAAVWDLVLDRGARHDIRPIGLGARDTLRLEARLCLYGNDIDEQHNPHEAGLSWVVKGKGFVGEAALERAKQAIERRLVGFKVIGRGIARHGYDLYAGSEKVGVVTSGTVAPTVGGAVGMGYVPSRLAEPGTRLTADCRGKPAEVELVKGPFYKRAA